MRIDNNNQTNFGMQKILPMGVSNAKLTSLIERMTPDALKIGDSTSVAFIEEVVGNTNAIAIRVAKRTSEESCVWGIAQGKLGLRSGKNLLDLLRAANQKMSDTFATGKNQTYSVGAKEDLEFLAKEYLNVSLGEAIQLATNSLKGVFGELSRRFHL